MTATITAVVLSVEEYPHRWPGVDEILVHRSVITNAAELQRARFNAALRVRTTHFFYLDDDDALPGNCADVLLRCSDAGAALAYTDEVIVDDDGKTTRTTSAPYSQALHLRRPLLVHHLSLYETGAAQQAVRRLPRGHYAPEQMLAWEVAKRGAVYVPEVGYVWNRWTKGMHTWPETSLSQARAMVWARDNP